MLGNFILDYKQLQRHKMYPLFFVTNFIDNKAACDIDSNSILK